MNALSNSSFLPEDMSAHEVLELSKELPELGKRLEPAFQKEVKNVGFQLNLESSFRSDYPWMLEFTYPSLCNYLSSSIPVDEVISLLDKYLGEHTEVHRGSVDGFLTVRWFFSSGDLKAFEPLGLKSDGDIVYL